MNLEPEQTYRNQLGVIMVAKRHARMGGLNVIGDIWIAESPDEFFGPEMFLVTAQGLEGAGYEKVSET